MKPEFFFVKYQSEVVKSSLFFSIKKKKKKKKKDVRENKKIFIHLLLLCTKFLCFGNK